MSSCSIDLFGRNSGIIYVQLVSREGFISYLRLGSQKLDLIKVEKGFMPY